MKEDQNKLCENPWDKVPSEHRKTLELVIDNPTLLIPLMQAEIRHLEEYASRHNAQTSYPSYTHYMCDHWGNPLSTFDYCRGKAKYLDRICKAITIPDKTK
jgi:hypothetical protein